MKEFYEPDITEETKKELIDFVKWYNKLVGHEPLIVGGWAAWAYHKSLGSKDIDVVFPGEASKQVTLLEYFQRNDYKQRPTSFFDYEFYKIRKTSGGREVEVLVDAVSSNRKVIVSGTSVTIPWGFAERFKREYSFSEDAKAYIVEPELLLVYKIGALIGRSKELQTATATQNTYFESKLWKDVQDVYGLLKSCDLDPPTLFYLLKESCLMVPGSSWVDSALEVAYQHIAKDDKPIFARKWRTIMFGMQEYFKIIYSDVPGGVYGDVSALIAFKKFPDLFSEIFEEILTSSITRHVSDGKILHGIQLLKSLVGNNAAWREEAKKHKEKLVRLNARLPVGVQGEMKELLGRIY